MDEASFLKAVAEHKGIIVKVCRTYFESKHDQEDLFQEILLQLWKSVNRFKGNAAFSTWIYKVAINTALIYFKKDKKRKDVEEKAPALIQAPEEDIQLSSFYKAVQELNKIEKALIIQYIDGLSGVEIAKNMGISPGNVRVKINRIKNKLQNIIKENGYEF